jgi:maltooligosyltrehalose trehalohydrolase
VEQLGTTLGRKLVIIAESDLNDPRLVRSREAGGYGLDAQWSDDFHHALFTLLYAMPGRNAESEIGYYADFGSMEDLVKALTKVFVYDGQYSVFRGHSHGRPVEGLPAQRFVCFAQNHDQVGNRARGERLEQLAGMDAAKVALGLVLTAPFVPLLFMGEEFAASSPFLYFANHDEPEMAKLVFEGRKREFAAFGFDAEEIPNPEDRSTFVDSRLKWSEVHECKHAEMLTWTRELIHLRRTTLALNDGDLGHLKVQFEHEKRWLILERGSIRVLVNLGDPAASFDVRPQERLRLSSRTLELRDAKLELPAMTLAVLESERAL